MPDFGCEGRTSKASDVDEASLLCFENSLSFFDSMSLKSRASFSALISKFLACTRLLFI